MLMTIDIKQHILLDIAVGKEQQNKDAGIYLMKGLEKLVLDLGMEKLNLDVKGAISRQFISTK